MSRWIGPISSCLKKTTPFEVNWCDNPFAGVVMAHLRALETSGNATLRRQEKLALVRWLYGRGYEAEEVRRLVRFIDWLLLLPREAEQAFLTDVHAFEEEAHMPSVVSYERLALEDGERKGREVGREEGLHLGERKGLLLGIEPLLSIKFGEAGEYAFEEIRQIEDVAVLEAIVQRLRTVTSLDDIRVLYQHLHS